MDEERYCKNCKYAKRDCIDRFFRTWACAICTHPIRKKYDLVNGKTVVSECSDCHYQRRTGSCGKEGINFEEVFE